MGKIGPMELILILLIIFWYFLPTIIAVRGHHPNTLGVFLINFLLGFTLVGWVIALVWSLSATKVTSTQGTFKQLNALEIAKERFARGEITNEEFDNIKRRLS